MASIEDVRTCILRVRSPEGDLDALRFYPENMGRATSLLTGLIRRMKPNLLFLYPEKIGGLGGAQV